MLASSHCFQIQLEPLRRGARAIAAAVNGGDSARGAVPAAAFAGAQAEARGEAVQVGFSCDP